MGLCGWRKSCTALYTAIVAMSRHGLWSKTSTSNCCFVAPEPTVSVGVGHTPLKAKVAICYHLHPFLPKALNPKPKNPKTKNPEP